MFDLLKLAITAIKHVLFTRQAAMFWLGEHWARPKAGWKELSRFYRKHLFTTALWATKGATLSLQRAQEVIQGEDGALSLAELLRRQLRFFTDGVILGTQEWAGRSSRSLRPTLPSLEGSPLISLFLSPCESPLLPAATRAVIPRTKIPPCSSALQDDRCADDRNSLGHLRSFCLSSACSGALLCP